MSEIVVAIPTFRRPQGLERLLASIASLDTQRALRIIVADNDAAGCAGFHICAQLNAHGYRWPLQALVVPDRGIAQVRNALVGAALNVPDMHFIVMLDDDQWVDPDWLDALAQSQARTGADVVRGAVLRVFESAPPRWAAHWEGIADILSESENEPVEGTGNVLIARRCFETLAQPWFDPQFGLTGGEDRDFFLRLYAGGFRSTHAREAIVREFVPAERLNLNWSLMRAYRTGNSDLRMALKYAPGPSGIVREIVKIMGALACVPVLALIFSFDPSRRLDGVRKLYRIAGKIGALFGHRYYEYATPNDL